MARFLLLHAFPFTGAMWDGVAARLRAEGHDVITPDLRGFGSAPLGERTPALSVLVDDMVIALGEQPAVVVGCSMGGYVALGIAALRPDLVAALGLVDTKATADPEPARIHRLRIAELAETGGDWSAGMVDGLLGETTRRTRADLVIAAEEALSAAPPATVAWAQRAMSARSDARESLAMLTAPIAVVMGEEDTMSPRDEQELILEAVPHATWVPVSGAGHLSPLEAPDAVASALVNLVVVDERGEID
jgi:pimeloyl-ACP methyl ester carboxylesterase